MCTSSKRISLLLTPFVIFIIYTNCAAAAQGNNCSETNEITRDDALTEWSSVYSSFKRFGDCVDQSLEVQKAFGAAEGRLLTQNWNELPSLNRLISNDKDFEQFVILQMADLGREVEMIAREARDSCPPGLARLCRLLESRAEELQIERRNPSAEELNGPECNLLQADRWIGRAAIQGGTNAAVDTALPCLLTLWRDDRGGSTKFTVSDGFLSLMAENPSEFFSLMSHEPKIFADWVSDLDNLSFTWPHEPPCQLEATRSHLLTILQRSDVPAGRPSSLKDSVVAKLMTTRCRQIQ